jgi:glycerophosphoryl diester phosphodiesterase
MATRPIVIAHRGASGYLPEHTLEAKVLAYGLGADYIEQDVVATRDGALVVLHDLVLDAVTNVADVYPGRARRDGLHYVIDFDLDEIEQLEVTERRRTGTADALFPGRFPPVTLGLRLTTLANEIRLIQGLNRTMGRDVGIYPEVKDPAWHREHGIDLGARVLEELDRFGYRSASDRAYVQCFEQSEVVRMRIELETRLKLVQLLPPTGTGGRIPSAAELDQIASVADGVGLPLGELVDVQPEGASQGPAPNGLGDTIRAAGLALHPYTFRKDQLPPWIASFEALLELFFDDIGVDGLFCDFPDVAVRVRDSMSKAAP